MEAVSKNLLKIKIIQYRSNVSWQSLKTRTTRLDPQSSKLENFEYQVLSRVPQVSSQVVWVSSRSDKKIYRSINPVRVNLAGLLLETEKFSGCDSRGRRQIYICNSVGLVKSVVLSLGWTSFDLELIII